MDNKNINLLIELNKKNEDIFIDSVNSFNLQNNLYQQEIVNLNNIISKKSEEINFMKSSKFWKIKVFYEKFKFPILKLLRLIKKSIFVYKKYGGIILVKKIHNFFAERMAVYKDESKNSITYKFKPIKFVYYISNLSGGGAKKYIDDLIENFQNCHLVFIKIKNLKDLNYHKNNFRNDDILLFQYVFDSDISFVDILNVKKDFGLKLIVTIHDFYFLGKSIESFYNISDEVHKNYINKDFSNPHVFNLLKESDLIIYPSHFVKNIFDSIYAFKNSEVSDHIDYKINTFLSIPKVEEYINIGIINNITIYKGLNLYPKLFDIKNYKGYNIRYHVFGSIPINNISNVIFHGPYHEDEIFKLLKTNKIHGLVFLNEYPETYSYSLTKGINSGLPILYSNIGAYTERLENNNKFFPVEDISQIRSVFDSMLLMILNKQDINFSEKVNISEIYIPELYKKIFSIDYNQILNEQYNKNKNSYIKAFSKIEPYAIYFPQFHALDENEKTFYKGYHDMINLQQVKNVDLSIEVPLKGYLDFYNLKEDKDIFYKQILLAKANGFKGFGIYYYWFSHNSVTGNNMIMKDAIDSFFAEDILDFDVFFIYANESWSNNPAFNQTSNNYIIKNEFNEKEIRKNFLNLLPYFKNKNYKKINNKPVFFIHHPWEMTESELQLFFYVGNEMLKANGFNGLELIVNSMHGDYRNYKNYSHNPDYKTSSLFTKIENGLRFIDYKKYVDVFIPTLKNRDLNIQSVFYNFNNSVRYFNHKNKNILITRTKNNNIEYFRKFLKLQFHTYKNKKKVSKIFLVNSWNEWGEQMAVEPSNESGFLLLDTYREALLDFVDSEEDESIDLQ